VREFAVVGLLRHRLRAGLQGFGVDVETLAGLDDTIATRSQKNIDV